MTETLSQFAQSLLALALPILAAYLAATLKEWMAQAAARLESQTSAEVRDLMYAAAHLAVRAAEQMGGDGQAKLAMAQDIAQKYLAGHGVKLDVGLLRGLIESAVLSEFGKPQRITPAPNLWYGHTLTVPATQDTAAPAGREIE